MSLCGAPLKKMCPIGWHFACKNCGYSLDNNKHRCKKLIQEGLMVPLDKIPKRTRIRERRDSVYFGMIVNLK